ncbi:MAG: F0F1 ATP synthase subunit gamma, partial [Rhodopirellula sp.]|nr:F0F1 ATP synthase subunit gamma [Rhodopirellula sp.]
MAKARAIVKRLKAVKNIRKITRTMELIATARFKKAMDRATEAASYTKKISEIVADLSKADLSFSHPLLTQPEEQTKNVLLVLTSNRGLCGGYNASVLRHVTGRLKQARTSGEELAIEVAGKRGLAYLKFQELDYAKAYTNFEDKPRYDEVEEIANRYIEGFIAGDIHRVDVAYTRFESSSRQTAVLETLLPVGSLGNDSESDSNETAPGVDYEFLPSTEDILEEIVPAALKARL